MASQIKITRAIRELAALKKINHESAKLSSYSRGVYNGIELALAILQDRDAVLVEKRKIERSGRVVPLSTIMG